MKAGLHQQDVTPPVGIYLAGYPSRNEGSTGVDDPLYLRIAALQDDAGSPLVLVTADLLKFPQDMAWRLKRWCADELGVPSAQVVINLSHTHASPALFLQRCYPQWPVDIEYVRGFEAAIREGIVAALADLRPATLRFGLHQAHFGVNRRLVTGVPGVTRIAANPDGYHDPDLPVFALERDGQLAAVIYSYACHPTSKSTRQISADWPGQVAAGLRRELGEAVMPLFLQGAAGSVMPRMRYGDDIAGYERYWAAVAADLAAFVRGGLPHIEPRFEARETTFLLPYDLDRMPPREELLEYASPAEFAPPERWRPANRSILRLWAQDLLEAQRLGTVPTGFEMHAAWIALTDELQILALSGEITAEVGRLLKDLFPDRRTVLCGYCSYTDAYIPTAAMLPEGGHEALGSICFHERPAPFTPEIDDILRREVGELVKGVSSDS